MQSDQFSAQKTQQQIFVFHAIRLKKRKKNTTEIRVPANEWTTA